MSASNEVRVGIMFVIGLALLVVMIVAMTRWGQIRNSYPFSISLAQAQGIQDGAIVRVSGVEMGRVTKVSYDQTTHRALVEARIDRRVALHRNDRYNIGTGGLVGELFVEITPTTGPQGDRVKPGDIVEGTTTPNLSDVMASANVLVAKLSTATDNLNVIIGDRSTQANLRATMENLKSTSEALSKIIGDPNTQRSLIASVNNLRVTTAHTAAMAQSLNELVRRDGGQVDALVTNLASVSQDIKTISDTLAPQIIGTDVFANMEAAALNVRNASDRLDRIANTVDNVVNNKELVASLLDSVRNLRQASTNLEEMMAEARDAVSVFPAVSSNLMRATSDLPQITAPLRDVAPEVAEDIRATAQSLRNTSESIGNVAQAISTAGSGLTSLSIETEAQVMYMPSRADGTRSDLNLNLRSNTGLLRLGATDIGKTTRANVQFGERLSDQSWIRYGLMQSRFGVGLDYQPARDMRWTFDLFDPDQPRANTLFDYRFRPLGNDFWLSAGWYDLFQGGNWGVGLTYRPGQ